MIWMMVFAVVLRDKINFVAYTYLITWKISVETSSQRNEIPALLEDRIDLHTIPITITLIVFEESTRNRR